MYVSKHISLTITHTPSQLLHNFTLIVIIIITTNRFTASIILLTEEVTGTEELGGGKTTTYKLSFVLLLLGSESGRWVALSSSQWWWKFSRWGKSRRWITLSSAWVQVLSVHESRRWESWRCIRRGSGRTQVKLCVISLVGYFLWTYVCVGVLVCTSEWLFCCVWCVRVYVKDFYSTINKDSDSHVSHY